MLLKRLYDKKQSAQRRYISKTSKRKGSGMKKEPKKYRLLYAIVRRVPGIPIIENEEYDFCSKSDEQALGVAKNFLNKTKKQTEIIYLKFLFLFRIIK